MTRLLTFLAILPALFSLYVYIAVPPAVVETHAAMIGNFFAEKLGFEPAQPTKKEADYTAIRDAINKKQKAKREKAAAPPAVIPPRAPDSELNGPYDLCEAQLLDYKGFDESKPLLVSVGGFIFDISAGSKFYGPGMAYNVFAGRVATRALSIGSMDEVDLTDDLTGVDMKNVEGQIEFYSKKYEKVGTLRQTCK
jgi:membrane-associated progesterone receptor component